MKYCPYCGADLIEDAVSFCAECGKQLPAGKAQKEKPKEKPEIKKTSKKKKKKPVKNAESSIEVETVVDDGYDGYYDDIRPIDEGHEREGIDKDLVKKIVTIIAVLFVVIIRKAGLPFVKSLKRMVSMMSSAYLRVSKSISRSETAERNY